MDALGIAAPLAPQRATLKEHGRPHSGAVVNGEMLDVQDDSFEDRFVHGW
jgi:hypothetical protein